MKTILKVFVAFVALGLTFSAGYFSVLGLTKMFAGAFLGTAIVCSFAEFSKLIIASVLHQYKTKLKIVHKALLAIALVITMFITSLGVYGYLTNGFQVTANQLELLEKQVSVIDMKRARFQEQLDGYSTEKTQLAESISELSKGLSNNVIEYKDRETGEIIRTTSSATRQALQEQLNDFKEQRNLVSSKIENLTDSITKLDLQVIDIESNNDAAAEIGPLKFIVEFTGYPMNTVVNFITLLLVIVIDPLAILLVLVFNKITDKEMAEQVKMSTPDGMEFDTKYPLPENEELEGSIPIDSSAEVKITEDEIDEAIAESEYWEHVDQHEQDVLDDVVNTDDDYFDEWTDKETNRLMSGKNEEVLSKSIEQPKKDETVPFWEQSNNVEPDNSPQSEQNQFYNEPKPINQKAKRIG